MILGICSTIFAGLGIYGFFNDNLTLLYIGMGCVILEHLIGILSKQQKSLTTVWLALLASFGMMAGGIYWLEALALCLCFEGVICFVLGLIMIIMFGTYLNKKQSNEKTNNSEETIQEFMAKSGLSKIICTDIFEILVCFSYENKDLAYSKIDNQLIPHLKESADIGSIGVAFGMLIDKSALSEEESQNYSSKLIEELILNE